MKQTENLFIIIQLSLILFLFLNASPGWGGDVKLIEKIEFSPGSELPLKPKSFCVTEDEVFIIPDYQAGNIKIYEKVYENNKEFLRLEKNIGRKGYGPDELSRPTACFYSKNESKFGIMDLGIRKIFLYDRIGRMDFIRVKEVSCWRGAYDIKLEKNRLLISGYNQGQDEEPYDFYYVDLTNDQTTFLLPSYYKYGLKSHPDYYQQYRGEYNIRVIGIIAKFDILNNDVYFVWEGNLKIIKIDILSGEINQNTFVEEKSNYKKPYATDKMIEAYQKKDIDFIDSKRKREGMSYIRNIFTSSKYVLVIYEGSIPNEENEDRKTKFWLRFYFLDGKLEKEIPINAQSGSKMWLDKDRDILFLLSSESNLSGGNYFILKYEISGSGGGYP
jgi:hypothetical protein